MDDNVNAHVYLSIYIYMCVYISNYIYTIYMCVCTLYSTQSFVEELLRAWPLLARSGLSCGRRSTQRLLEELQWIPTLDGQSAIIQLSSSNQTWLSGQSALNGHSNGTIIQLNS